MSTTLQRPVFAFLLTWHQRIADAAIYGSFTRYDKQLASNWVTCACGVQDPRIPVNLLGEPLDEELRELGHQFYWAVNSDSFYGAERIIQRIETRAAEVLREQEQDIPKLSEEEIPVGA